MKTKRFKVEIDFFDDDEDEIHENIIKDWVQSSYEFDNIHVEVRVEELKEKSQCNSLTEPSISVTVN